MKPLSLNEALKYAGLPQRTLTEGKKLSSDEIKAKLLPNVKGQVKQRIQDAEFKFSHRGQEHLDDRSDQDDNSKADIYDSTANGWFMRVAVLDGGGAKVIESEKLRSSSDD